MACIFIVLATIIAAVSAVPTNIQDPGCSFRVNDLGQPQPLYLRNGDYLEPTGNTGAINVNTGDEVVIACPGRKILHPKINASVDIATATCESNELVSGVGWLDGSGAFSGLTCSALLNSDAVLTTDRCYNNNTVIRVGFTVEDVFYPLYWSCFDPGRLEVLYVWYEQKPQNALPQTGVKRPGSFSAGTCYPGVSVNKMYTQVQQKATIANIVGSTLANKYITEIQFLSRGHLAAKTDFIYANGQRASFYFINAAPQWQPFNGGNWNSVEQNLRTRIGNAGYTTIYTGTFLTSQLRDENDQLFDIYLYTDANNNPQIPVPLYYYKVVYDASRRLGTAFVGINSPYYNETEVQALTFCADRCRNNSAFNWLKWLPDRIDLGYSFCCTVEDFRNTVPHLPDFPVDDLLT